MGRGGREAASRWPEIVVAHRWVAIAVVVHLCSRSSRLAHHAHHPSKCHHVPSSGGCDGALRAERTLNHSQPPGALDRHVVSLLKGSPKEARLACSSAVETAVLVQRVAFTKSQWIRPDGNSSTMAKRRLGDTRVHYIH